LEPNASDLNAEVQDQLIKAKITQNFCSTLKKAKVHGSKSIHSDDLFSTIPKSAKPEDIAGWHISNRRRGAYPALASEIQVISNPPEIRENAAFVNLPKNHPLARDFGGRNALCIEGEEAHFTWNNSRRNLRSPRFFVHAGFGGARKTADKLVSEAQRACWLKSHKKPIEFSPIPAIVGLQVGEEYAMNVKRALSSRL
jgi:hypothetical protein